MTPDVSVVVPTFRRPDVLDRCLGALVAQRCDPAAYEILVIDDAACDETRRQVEEWAARFRNSGPAIRYLAVRDTRGPAAARNVGWRQARADVIAFTDDDCIPEPGWLAAGLSAIRSGASGVSGRVVVPLPEHPTDYERNAASLETAEFITANCFYRREALESAGGFDERFTMAWREDSDLFFTLLERGESLVHAPEAVVVHPVRPARWGVSLGQQRKIRYSALLYKKHPTLYWERIQHSPRRQYYATVGSLATFLASLAIRRPLIATASFTLWAALTGEFIARRLRGASRDPAHIAEMVLTSAAIPPLAIYWRVRGAIEFRTPFL